MCSEVSSHDDEEDYSEHDEGEGYIIEGKHRKSLLNRYLK